jgi:hypothetical protein
MCGLDWLCADPECPTWIADHRDVVGEAEAAWEVYRDDGRDLE